MSASGLATRLLLTILGSYKLKKLIISSHREFESWNILSLQWVSVHCQLSYILAFGGDVCLFLQKKMAEFRLDRGEMLRVRLGVVICCLPPVMCANSQATNNFSYAL